MSGFDGLFHHSEWIVDEEEEKNRHVKDARLQVALDFLTNVSLNETLQKTNARLERKKSFLQKMRTGKNAAPKRFGNDLFNEKRRGITRKVQNNVDMTPPSDLQYSGGKMFKKKARRMQISPMSLPEMKQEGKAYVNAMAALSSISSSDSSTDDDSNTSDSESDSKLGPAVYLCPPPSAIPGNTRDHWESILLRSGILNSRLIFSRAKGAPTFVSSILFSRGHTNKKV